MAIERLIVGLTAAGIGLAGLLLALMIFGDARLSAGGARIAAAEERAGLLARLSTDTQAYAAKLAAVLLFGRPEMDDLGTARVEMERTLARLQQTTQAGIVALGTTADVRSELPEVDATRRLIELYHAIDASAARALAQQRAGRPADAMQLLQDEVQFRLSNELVPLVDSGAAGEAAEISSAQTAVAAGRRMVLAAAAGLAVAGGFVLAGIGWLAWRRATALSAASRDGAAAAAAVSRLEAEMAARTTQWQEANARLQAIDARRTQLLADISHQLRTPLTILRGEADVALRGRPRIAELRQALERIQGQAGEVAQLLDDLIAYARADAEAQGHAPADIAFGEVVNAAVREAQVLAEPREVTIATTLGDEDSHVLADQRHLRQALVIGFDNAIKHSPPGGRIDVETSRGDAAVAVRIADQGPGVSEAEKPHLFERFFRGRGEADFLNDGLGIGLAIAREIVDRHGGHISLDNRTGGGAVLEITLPLADRHAP